MRRILFILLSMLSFGATAQTVQTIGSPGTRVNSRGDFISDSIFYLPRTQVTSRTPFQSGAIRYQASDSSIYQWTGTAWRKISGTVDSLLFSTRAWRQKGIDSVVSLVGSGLTGTGISGYITRWSGTKTMDTSQIFQQANRIGIGNTAPAYILDITGTLRNTGNAFFNTSSGETLFGTTSDAGDFRVQISGNQYVSGNVGIGITSPASKLHVMGASPATVFDGQLTIQNTETSGAANTGGAIAFVVNDGANNRTISAIRAMKENSIIGDYGSYLTFYTRPNAGSNEERLRVSSTGLIGINTTSPSERLHVAGNTLFSATLNSGVFYFISSTNPNGENLRLSQMSFGSNDYKLQAKIETYSTEAWSSTNRGTYMTFGTTTTATSTYGEKMRLNDAGELLINTTTDGGDQKLQVNGRVRIATIDSSASPINMLWADVNGVVRKAPVPTASISGGTTDFIPLWSSSTALTSSIIEQRSSELLVNTNRDTGSYVLQVQGASWFGGAIKTMTDIDIGSNNALSSGGRNLVVMGTSGTSYMYSSGAGTAIQFYPNNVLGMFIDDDNELMIAPPSGTVDSGDYKIQVFGNTFTNGSITTAAPSGGSKKPWKLGAKIAGAVSLDQGNYLEVEVDGVFYRIALVTPD